MLNRKLSELEADDLGAYSADVFFTVGSAPDFKYFLPRIFELSVRKEFSWPTPEVVFAKLPLANWEQWPDEEKVAILDVVKKKFESLLQDPGSDGSDVDQWICALGRCLPDVTPYLTPLLEQANEPKLLAFVERNAAAFTTNKLSNSFWDSAPDNEGRVVAWLNQPQIRTMLSERYGMIF
jgi:hypothetical protein